MHELQKSGQAILDPAPGTWSFLVRNHRTGQILACINPDEPYEVASVPKLSIALDVMEMINRGALIWREPLRLKAEHMPPRQWRKFFLRPGTGLLKDMSVGLEIPLSLAFGLMLVESDNVATNMLLDRLEGQSAVNDRLHARGIEQTGLTERDDRKFEPTLASAANMLQVLEKVVDIVWQHSFEVALGLLCRSHFVGGLRQFEKLTEGHRKQMRSRLIAGGLLRSYEKQLELMSQMMSRPFSTVASKEGILPEYQGVSYLHELAVFEPTSYEPLLVAVFSKGTADEGYSLEAAKSVLGELGYANNDYAAIRR